MSEPQPDADLATLAELTPAELEIVLAVAEGAITAYLATNPTPTTPSPYENTR